MSYIVKYAEALNKEIILPNKKPYILILSVIFVIAAVLFVAPLRNWIYTSFVPMNYKIVVHEFSYMTTKLKQGEPIQDAVTAFCEEIIANG